MADVRTLSPLERILVLRSMQTLEGLTSEDLARFAQLMTERQVEAGAPIAVAGTPITETFILLEGEAAVLWDGHRAPLTPPQGIGWLRLISGAGTNRQVEAVTPCELLAVDAAGVLRLLEQSPDLVEHNLRRFMQAILRLRGALPEGGSTRGQAPMGTRPERPLELIDRLQIMEETSPLWKRANMDALVTLARGMRELHLPAGTELWPLGARSDFGFMIRYGQVRCTAPDGGETWVGAGFGLGFFDAMAGAPRSQAAVADTDLVLLRWEVQRLYAVLENDARTAMFLLGSFARQAAELYDRAAIAQQAEAQPREAQGGGSR